MNSKTNVLLIGSGILNQMTSLLLAEKGFRLTVLESGRFPFGREPIRDDKSVGVGATLGGGDARMYTLTEADNYNEKGSLIYADMKQLFRKTVRRGGWSVKSPRLFTRRESQWVQAHEDLSPDLARRFASDIFGFNREAGGRWEAFIRAHPDLFEGVGYTPDILRLYTDIASFEGAIDLQTAVGATRGILGPAEVATKYPALRDACTAGSIAGGIEVVGWTLNVHRFAAKLLTKLQTLGVKVLWETRVINLRRDEAGCIAGITTTDREYRADHYVISTGTHGNELLRGTASDGRINGVLGVWLTIPNIDPPLTNSLKIHRGGTHVTEDCNVTLARDARGRAILLIGTGYGYTGEDPRDIDPDELAPLYDGAKEIARTFFKRAYEQATEAELNASLRYCVRPWTPTGLGVFEMIPATGGGKLIVTGGHNTGGFTQSPAVAAAVLAGLCDQDHPMHDLYHPRRVEMELAKRNAVLVSPEISGDGQLADVSLPLEGEHVI